MLQIINIEKEYRTGDLVQKALDGMSLNFRKNEFVSILGPSGSGKTTLLNIIGGLDSYDKGDLIINGQSTKNYKDADWDSYRNHTIGFVFQSYNLIMHQSVLGNVELALTIGGISKKERRKRAKQALIEVGLGEHIHKKPNQLSGGQMQRVAIARALVNNPDILLADEPTGALDTETSVQIMELLKQVANDRLVIMVTHNSEIAEEYSSRIVRVKDGKMIDDTNPFNEESQNTQKTNKHKKAKMSFKTSFALSFNNLRTKKRRTLLTAFAGSIGIIGISLILSLSTGTNQYIADLQEDTMASYPLTISAETIDMIGVRNEIISTTLGSEGGKITREDAIYSDNRSLEAVDSVEIINNLTPFKEYLDNPESEIRQYISANGITYSYNINASIFSYDKNDELINSNINPLELLDDESGISTFTPPTEMIFTTAALGGGNFSEIMSGGSDEMINSAILENYDIIHGAWPTEYNELVLFLDEDNTISIDILVQLGLISADEYVALSDKVEAGEIAEAEMFTYDEILNHNFYAVVEADRYVKNDNGTFSYNDDEDYSLNEDILKENMELKIVGIAKFNSDETEPLVSATIGYTNKFTEKIIEITNASDVIIAQNNTPDVNVLTGFSFEALSDEEKADDTKEYISNLGITEKANLYSTLMSYSGSTANIPTDEVVRANMMDAWLAQNPSQDILLNIYDQSIGGGSFNDNMDKFGEVSYDSPSAINIYTDSFEAKEGVTLSIENYNTGKAEEEQIIYTDYVQILTSSMTTIIDIISYVLIAFVGVSLVVSSIMIGIITHISVMERTKEIGVLRALGASKRNISQVFNAETMIIGLCSGLLGVGITILLNIPITSIIQSLVGSSNVSVNLPIANALMLIALSVVITIIGGLVPAKSAAKKDPVIALRTE